MEKTWGRRWKGWRGLGDPKGETEETVNWPWPGAECPGHPHHRLSVSQFGSCSSPASPPLLSLSTAMKVMLCLVLALAVTTCLCLPRPAAEAPAAALGAPQQHPPALVRRDWPQSLSQEQQQRLAQFLPHVLTGTGSSGWVGSPQGAQPGPSASSHCCLCPGRAEQAQGLCARGRGDGGFARPLLPRLDGLRPPQC